MVVSCLGLPYVPFYDQKNLSSENAKKCLLVFFFGVMNNENMSNHSSTKNFGKLYCELLMTFFSLLFTCFLVENWSSVDMMTFFLVFTCFLAENWPSADMMTLEEPVLLLRNENMVILVLLRNFCRYHSKRCVLLYFAEPIRNTLLYSLESSAATSERL